MKVLTMQRKKLSYLILKISLITLIIVYIVNDIDSRITHINNKEIECLAKNIYFEARGEDYIEKIMVANVTMNRLRNSKFPNSICGVVYQKSQFSWTKYEIQEVEHYTHNNHKELIAWNESVDIAKMTVGNMVVDLSAGAMFYHNNKVRPKWSRHMTKVAQTKGHKWYKISSD